MAIIAIEQEGTKSLRRYRLSTLLIVMTIVCIALTGGKLWRDYQRGARDRGFIAGLKLAIDEGPDGFVLSSLRRSSSSRNSDDYQRGVLEGKSYISHSSFITTAQQRRAQTLSKLALDFELDKSLKARATQAIREER